jgi:hypothetical protein
VYAIDRSARSRSGIFERTSILPPAWRRKVRSRTLRTVTSSSAPRAAAMASACASSRQSTLTSSMIRAPVDSTMSRAVMLPPASPTAVAIRPS